eukprot:s6_g41.t1
MAAAFWQWERQVFLVCGYLRYIRALERNLGMNDRDRSICGLASGMLHADAPVVLREELRHKHRKNSDFKTMLLKAIDGLVAQGLLLCDKDPRKEQRPKKKRRKAQASQGEAEPEAAADAPAVEEKKEMPASRVVLSLRKPPLAELSEQAEAERPRSRTDDSGEGHQPAAAPADFEQAPKHDRLPEKHSCTLEQLAGRLACGRTSSVLLSILGTNPFKRSAAESLPTLTGNAPCRGMTATLQGSMVFVLDTFTRRSKLHADIANVRRRADQDWTLGSISTVKADCLADLRVELVVTAVSGTQVRLQRLSSTQVGGALTLVPALPTEAIRQPIDTVHDDVHVVPAAAQAHAEHHGHKIIPMRDRAGTEVILDIPHCKSFTYCPYRCLTCKQCPQASKAPGPSYFNFTDEDVRQTFPHVCIVRTPKEKKHYMTKRYLLEVLLQFYCKLNCREVRRGLMDICCANSLQTNLLQQAHAIPKSKVLRHVVVQAFGRCLDDIVDSFQQKLFLYNAQGVRHDGNMGLARRVVLPHRAPKRPCQKARRRRWVLGKRKRCGRVVLAFTGWPRSACVDPQPDFREKKAQQSEAVGELKAFLGLPHVQLSPTWKEVMGSLPPRGTLVRVANRIEASLHATSQGFGWTSPQAFRREARRIIRWYKKGKKTMRYNRNLPRTQRAPEYVRGLKTCWTQKVALHYRRFFGKIRQEGLWSWRLMSKAMRLAKLLMSKAMRLAKLSQQSGTVSVERVWSYYLAEFPQANRGMSLDYFNVMSALLFLRFNLQHFKAQRLPGWLENDALVATQRDECSAFPQVQPAALQGAASPRLARK